MTILAPRYVLSIAARYATRLAQFDQVDLGRVQALPQRDRDRLEGGLLLVAAQMGLEVKRDAA